MSRSCRCSLQGVRGGGGRLSGSRGEGEAKGEAEGDRLAPNPSLPLGSGHRPIQEKPKAEGILGLGRK